MRVRQYVYFALFSRHTSAEEMARWLGIEPDEITVRGSRGAEPVRPISHAWKVVCREPGLSVDEQVSHVLERLRPHTDRIAELAARLRAENAEDAEDAEDAESIEDAKYGGAVLEVVRYLNDHEDDPRTPLSNTMNPEALQEPALLGWHLDLDVLRFLTATGAALDVDEYDMT
ncbi:DUF4279 domain-containing protein [Streptosporangium sp. NPDC002721]|uniref:DUF4279 domain-containing protein n=1 Tax=Streptosporangium sp. NPDC002721 TaxID=3366188 RepID=UPI003691ED84